MRSTQAILLAVERESKRHLRNQRTFSYALAKLLMVGAGVYALTLAF